MLQISVMHFDNAYLFQQVVVFLMWMGLMKIAVGELKAILKEEREPHTFSLQLPADEPGRGLRKAPAPGRRGTVQSVWTPEAKAAARARIQVGGRWRRVGVP